MRKSAKVKLEEYMRKKAKDKKYKEDTYTDKDLHPNHPDNR